MRFPSHRGLGAVVVMAAVVLGVAAPAALAGSSPGNDNLSGSFPLDPPPSNQSGPGFTNALSTSETNENVHPGALGPGCTGPTTPTTQCLRSVWYGWTAPAAPIPNDAVFTITTCDAAANFNTTIGLYANGTSFPLTLVKGDNDAPTGASGRPDLSACPGAPTLSSLTFTATPAVTYKLAVAGAAGAQGDFGLQVYNGYDTVLTDATAGGAPMAAGDTVSSRDVSFSYASVEPNLVSPAGHTYQCRLQRAGGPAVALAACGTPRAYSGLANGDYTFEVADDTDPVSTTFDFTVAGAAAGSGIGGGLGGAPAGLQIGPGAGVTKAKIAGGKSAGVSRVNKSGVATLKTKIDCRASATRCTYKDTATGRLSKKSKKKNTKLGGFKGTIAAGNQAAVKVKLNKTAREAIASGRELKVKVAISAAAAAGTVKKTVKATLKSARAGRRKGRLGG